MNFSAPKCTCPTLGDNVEFVEPCSEGVTRGSVVHMKCTNGKVLASGQLSLACGEGGQFLGTPPTCAGNFMLLRYM